MEGTCARLVRHFDSFVCRFKDILAANFQIVLVTIQEKKDLFQVLTFFFFFNLADSDLFKSYHMAEKRSNFTLTRHALYLIYKSAVRSLTIDIKRAGECS